MSASRRRSPVVEVHRRAGSRRGSWSAAARRRDRGRSRRAREDLVEVSVLAQRGDVPLDLLLRVLRTRSAPRPDGRWRGAMRPQRRCSASAPPRPRPAGGTGSSRAVRSAALDHAPRVGEPSRASVSTQSNASSGPGAGAGRRDRSWRQRATAAGEVGALGRVRRRVDRGVVRRPRVGTPAEAAQQVGARRVPGVVTTSGSARPRRAGPLGEGDRGGRPARRSPPPG